MRNTFGLFENSGDGTGFDLLHIISSPYEEESNDGVTMIRLTERFDFGSLPFEFNEELLQSGLAKFLKFQADNTVGFRTDMSVNLIWDEEDEVNGLRAVYLSMTNFNLQFPWFSELGTKLRELFPQGYTDGGSY